MTQKIITLPKQLVNQIAAGEVVERPVSVVKELLENSLDAGATQIDVALQNGGIDDIQVRDNGLGIPPEDLLKALEKYSTSKIRSIDDLYKVMTFGFRGEALASISSVSDFHISSKTKGNPEGKKISTQGGDEFQEEVVAHEVGTTVQVEKLFFNTPARLSYLKKPRTEYLKTQEFLQRVALAYPEIGFTLIHDGKTTCQFPKNQSIRGRIYDIFGAEFSENMKKISHVFSGIKVTGWISDPKISFKNKSRQVLFVNKRVINSPMIAKAISDAYNRFIPHGSYPGYILSLEIDPTQVDVNVHPRKMEVRFAEESSIFRSVYHGVKDELERVSLVSGDFLNTHLDHQSALGEDNKQESSPKYYTGSGTKFKNYSPYKNTGSNPAQAGLDFSREMLGGTKPSASISNRGETQKGGGNYDLRDTPLGRIVGQIHNSYIAVETPTGVQILDQHALAERVIYEKLAGKAYTPQIQQLLGGAGVHLTSSELETFETYNQAFTDMGFEIDILSQGNITISGVPDFMKKQNIETFIKEMLGDMSGIGSKAFDEVRHKIWAYAACRSAIKFGDPLSIFEMHSLLHEASIDYSATCPHGRPVIWEIGLEELQKKYER